MKLLRIFSKPEYLLRPAQIVRRLVRSLSGHGAMEKVVLPWGLSIRVSPNEVIGASIWKSGLFELGVSECLWRLLDAGETALDVGANIGYMTCLLARRAGVGGKVIALEPHPQIFTELDDNVAGWTSNPEVAEIRL